VFFDLSGAVTLAAVELSTANWGKLVPFSQRKKRFTQKVIFYLFLYKGLTNIYYIYIK